MRIVVLDDLGVDGPAETVGARGYFSRFTIDHIRKAGHTVDVLPAFNAQACSQADAVWSEWCTNAAFQAAASGVCKRLVIRFRGIDVWGQLTQFPWTGVDGVVYESPFLRKLAIERCPGLNGFNDMVIPGGVRPYIPFLNPPINKVIALVARAAEGKGYQLAYEFAHQHPEYTFHLATARESDNPRFARYLQHAKPENVTLHGDVDTIPWLQEVQASFLLSASSWESFGYTVAEGMALGLTPLVHDTPGVIENWKGMVLAWRSLAELGMYIARTVLHEASERGVLRERRRAWVMNHLEPTACAIHFLAFLSKIPERTTPVANDTPGALLNTLVEALASGNVARIDHAADVFRSRTRRLAGLDDHRYGVALRAAGAHYNIEELEQARVWAARALLDRVQPDALALIGECAAGQNDFEGAVHWYKLACATDVEATNYPTSLAAGRAERLLELQGIVSAPLPPMPAPRRYLFVVTARNAEKWIERCLESIVHAAEGWDVFLAVVDDCSTDSTYTRASICLAKLQSDLQKEPRPKFAFDLKRCVQRAWSLNNVVAAIRREGLPGDVCVIVDGDDEFVSLEGIDAAYKAGAWLTYGNFRTTSGQPNWMPPYPLAIRKAAAFRGYPWAVSHPKTFRFELFEKLTDDDLLLDGQWPHTAGDVALMLPMLEMAAERAVYVPEVGYVYNDESPDNDHRLDPGGQVRVRDLYRAKPPHQRLETLDVATEDGKVG